MPRGGGRSSGGSSRTMSSGPSKSAAPPPAVHRAPPPPAPKATPPPPAPVQQQQQGGGGMLSGIGSTIIQGMAFGTGSAIAHRAVGAVADSFGGSKEAPAAPAPVQAAPVHNNMGQQGPCHMDMEAFNRCMRENNNAVTSCDFYYQALQQCQSNSSY